MSTTTIDPIENATEEAKSLFHKAIDFLYGTKARTNRTIFVLMAMVIGAKLLESMVFVPYCGV